MMTHSKDIDTMNVASANGRCNHVQLLMTDFKGNFTFCILSLLSKRHVEHVKLCSLS